MLDKPIQYLKGVGPKRAKYFSRIKIETIRDLLCYFPREYDDRRNITKISALTTEQRATVCGRVGISEILRLNQKLSVFKAAISDVTGIVYAVFFRRANPYHSHNVFGTLQQAFSRGNTVLVNGRLGYGAGFREIEVEEYEVLASPENISKSLQFNRIVPIYPLTEGLYQKTLREIMKLCLDNYSQFWPEIAPERIRTEKKLITSIEALREIHFPSDFSKAETARQKLAFDEFLLLETALMLVRAKIKLNVKSQHYTIKRTLLTPFRKKLGFDFTGCQKKVINEIFSDMNKSKPMNRLLLGDVGSGKTVVALSAALLAVENNYQAAILVPTEILAEQHYLTISQILSGIPVKIAVLTSKLSSKKKEKQKLIQDISSGQIDIVVGTHALIEKQIKFENLSLAVIDEQHRFGVLQKAEIQSKSENTDILVMSATPIPRTLALTMYGDMDLSIIEKLPPGRKPITTLHIDEISAYNLVKEEISKGNQAYIVYPLVEESDKVELKSAVEEAEKLPASVFRDFRVGLLHGQMKAELKQTIMFDFRQKKFDVLISTTVIEVGIDIPNATVMVIEHADRFGLATLHQLRGRVGRGQGKSFCVLLGNPTTDEARRRIEIMISTQDGFKIADEDLSIRGPGEFFGTAQHGMPELKAGNLITDIKLLEEARECAKNIISQDQSLKEPGHQTLRSELLRIYRNRFDFLNIG